MKVHVQDSSDLYLVMLKHAISLPTETKATPGSHGWSNLIYARLDQHTWKPVVTLLGDLLHARGAVSIGEGEGEGYMFGGKSFMEVSQKAKDLGWGRRQPDIMQAMRLALPPKA
jgi:hypothetical protein